MNRFLPVVAATLAAATLSSCHYGAPPRRSAATGALIGAGLGAAIGSLDGNAGSGALIGAAAGSVAGALYAPGRGRHPGVYRHHVPPGHARFVPTYGYPFYGHPAARGRVVYHGHPSRGRIPVYRPGRIVHPGRGVYYVY
jgi:hypothetical protein